MTQLKVLYTSADVRKEIIDLFSDSKNRRVAITAFVGEGAEAYLPNREGLELICWPKAGGTNPIVLRKLIKDYKVKVYFADSLHMKLYWTKNGAIVTSANLSTNALGSGDLREMGVLLPAGQIDIDRILSSLSCRAVSRSELMKLDRDTQAYNMKSHYTKLKSPGVSFPQWYEMPFRPKWKLGCWEGDCKTSKAAEDKAKEEYGVREANDFITCNKGNYAFGDWVLTFDLSGRKPTGIRWMCIDFVVRTSRSDRGAYIRECPYQAVQVWPKSRYPRPPFRADARFKNAFEKAVKEYGVNNIEALATTNPPKRLLAEIFSNFRK